MGNAKGKQLVTSQEIAFQHNSSRKMDNNWSRTAISGILHLVAHLVATIVPVRVLVPAAFVHSSRQKISINHLTLFLHQSFDIVGYVTLLLPRFTDRR
jgi:hypothetical protein